MTQFLLDTFTDTATTLITAHTGETGATWVANPDYNAVIRISTTGTVYCPSGLGVYYCSGTPQTPDYEVEAQVIVKSLSTNNVCGIMGRANAVSPIAFYWLRYYVGTGNWELYVSQTNNATLIGSYSQTLTIGQTYAVKLRMVGTSIKGFINGVERLSATSATVTDTGKPAIVQGTATDSTGLQITSITATDIVAINVFPSQIPINRTNYVLSLTGSSTSWDDSTVFTVSSGATKISQSVSATNIATLVVNTGDVTGTVTVSDGSVDTTFAVSLADKQILFDGNSLTAGNGATLGNSYPSQTLAILGQYWTGQNFGVSGQTTINMLSDVATQIDILYDAGLTQNILVAWEITNDLYFGASKIDAYNRFVQYCSERKSVGWKVLIITILPRTAGSPPSDFEESRAYCNEKLRSNWSYYADGLIDIASDSRLSSVNVSYYPDNVHLNNTGYGIVAGYVASVLYQLIAVQTVPIDINTSSEVTNCLVCNTGGCASWKLVNNTYIPAIVVCQYNL